MPKRKVLIGTILNLSADQIYSMLSQMSISDRKQASQLIGMRFKLKFINCDWNTRPDKQKYYECIGWNWGGHFNGWFKPEQLLIEEVEEYIEDDVPKKEITINN